jgi:hypothetical protein
MVQNRPKPCPLCLEIAFRLFFKFSVLTYDPFFLLIFVVRSSFGKARWTWISGIIPKNGLRNFPRGGEYIGEVIPHDVFFISNVFLFFLFPKRILEEGVQKSYLTTLIS